jgi:hypothetical protein
LYRAHLLLLISRFGVGLCGSFVRDLTPCFVLLLT